MRPIDPNAVAFREVALERLQYACQKAFPPAMLDQLSVERVADIVTGGVVYQFRAAIFAQRLDEQVVRYPADWWQALKQRFAPRWFVRRWPVLETIKTMRLYAWYPEKLIPGERSQFLVRVEP